METDRLFLLLHQKFGMMMVVVDVAIPMLMIFARLQLELIEKRTEKTNYVLSAYLKKYGVVTWEICLIVFVLSYFWLLLEMKSLDA